MYRWIEISLWLWYDYGCEYTTHILKYYGRALSSISESVTRLTRAGRMTGKVRRDFKIIPDVLSRVSLVTSNIRGSSICFRKSPYKKTSNEILRELKAAFKTGESKVPRPLSVLSSLLWQACVKQLALTHTLSPPRGREKKDATTMNFSSCSDHSWIINDCYIFSLTFEFEYFFFCALLSLQHKTLVLWNNIRYIWWYYTGHWPSG